MPVRKAVDEKLELLERSTVTFQAALDELVRASLSDEPKRREKALLRLSELLGDSMALADLIGRKRMLLEADRRREAQPTDIPSFIFAETPVVPNVEFGEAIEDLISRDPRLAANAEEVRRIYQETHGFALAQSADIALTRRIQKFITSSLRKGLGAPEASEVIAGMGDFTRAYSETVYRTNIATAYTAGRFKQTSNPDVADVIGALEYTAILDPDVRPNHAAAHGLLASQFDPIWSVFSPPLGYNCRCDVRMVDRFELKEKGLIGRDGAVQRVLPATFRLASPDPGFGRARADRKIYG